MANRKFIGGAVAVAQVDTLTPGGTIEIGDIFTITVTGERGQTATISFTATAATAANVAAGLIAAWNTSTDPLCTPITASGTDTVVLTADAAGVPFYVAASTTEAGGGAADDQTFTRAATTASSGPNDYNTTANWQDGVKPGASSGDVVYIDGATILYGLDQSGIANTVELHVTRSQIGANGSSGVNPTYLQIPCTKLDINEYTGAAAGTLKSPVNIDTCDEDVDIYVHSSGTNSLSTEPSVNLLTNDAAAMLYITAGVVGVATHSGETSQLSGIVKTAGSLYTGSGLTVATITDKSGASILRWASSSAITKEGGTLTTEGAGALSALNVSSGASVTSNASGTITALNTYGTVDFTQSQTARIVTTPKYGKGGVIKFDPSVLTRTNEIAPIPTSGNITLTAA